MATKKKLLTSGIAVVAAVGVLFGGTFAWQSISQQALNEVSASANPGGRLHDDFHDVTAEQTATQDGGPIMQTYDKNVYVENFTKYAENGTRIFARIRLDEYMEMGDGAGVTDASKNHAVSLVKGAKLSDKTTWTTLTMEGVENGTSPFAKYWNYTTGGQTTFMPTFNTNKDSLEADINGSFAANFKDYVDYSDEANSEKTGFAIYDLDDEGYGADGLKISEKDELAEALAEKEGDLDQIIFAESEDAATGYLNWLDEKLLEDRHISVKEETHTAAETATAKLMSIAEWNSKVDVEGYSAETLGGYWVYDTDGWFYWSEPINPEATTGLLLDQIQRTENTIDRDWYYGLNVVAQFVTADDLGRRDGTGFYADGAGAAPSADALKLLETIGVDVSATDVATADDLASALEQGGIVNLTEDITLAGQLEVTTSGVLNLNGHTIAAAEDFYNEETKTWSLISVRNGVTLTINDGTFRAKENDTFCVDVRDGSRVVINGGEFIGNISAVYVHEGEAFINGGTFSIRQKCIDTSESKQFGYGETLNCYDANWQNGTARISVTGGSFANFDPAAVTEDTSVNGGRYLAEGYVSTLTDGVYTVTAATAE